MSWERLYTAVVVLAICVGGYVDRRQNELIRELQNHDCECKCRSHEVKAKAEVGDAQ